MSIVERVIGHSVGAVLSSGAQNLDVLENIGLAVHVAERPLDAPADPHPSVHSLDHQDHLSTRITCPLSHDMFRNSRLHTSSVMSAHVDTHKNKNPRDTQQKMFPED